MNRSEITISKQHFLLHSIIYCCTFSLSFYKIELIAYLNATTYLRSKTAHQAIRWESKAPNNTTDGGRTLEKSKTITSRPAFGFENKKRFYFSRKPPKKAWDYAKYDVWGATRLASRSRRLHVSRPGVKGGQSTAGFLLNFKSV